MYTQCFNRLEKPMIRSYAEPGESQHSRSQGAPEVTSAVNSIGLQKDLDVASCRSAVSHRLMPNSRASPLTVMGVTRDGCPHRCLLPGRQDRQRPQAWGQGVSAEPVAGPLICTAVQSAASRGACES